MNIDNNNNSRPASPSPSGQSAPGRLQTGPKPSIPRPFEARFVERFDLKPATFDSLSSKSGTKVLLEAPKLSAQSGAQQKAPSVVRTLREMALFGLRYTAISVGSLLALPFVLTALVLFAAALVVEEAFIAVRNMSLFSAAAYAPAAG